MVWEATTSGREQAVQQARVQGRGGERQGQGRGQRQAQRRLGERGQGGVQVQAGSRHNSVSTADGGANS